MTTEKFTGFDFEIETEEQKATRIAAEKLEQKKIHQIEAVAKQNALPSHMCCARISDSNWSTRHHACGAKAFVTRSLRIDQWDKESMVANFSYCKRHDPVLKEEKYQAKCAEEKRVREAKWASQDRIAARQTLIAAAVGHLSNEKLVELAAFLATQEGFKKESK